jgi:glucose/arabinose dehydrogenase
MRPTSLLLAAALLAPLTQVCGQNPRTTGKINEMYAANCSNCHGKNLEGGQTPAGNKVPSLLDDEWIHGGDDDSIAKSIRNGYPEKEMPAWSATLGDKEIRSMVIFIRERRANYAREKTQFVKPAESMTVKSQLHAYKLDTWVKDLDEPYALAFLGNNRAIVTEKKGKVFLIENGQKAAEPLKGTPNVDTAQQAGMYDVVPHPQFAQNGWVYFAFADPQENAKGEKVSLTKIVRGKIRDNTLVDQQTIYQADVAHYPKAGGVHFGGRIDFDRQGLIYFVVGERNGRMAVQELDNPIGKIHRLHDDGRLPKDNPFVNEAKAIKSIWSYGHRNPQGMAFDRRTGDLYAVEHGPRGGDELNFIKKGANYGWPVISYGMEYNGTALTDLTEKAGMEQPVVYWLPSIAPCGMNFYTGDAFPKWKNHLFVASLVAQELRRIEIKDRKVVTQEVLFKDIGRIRHVIGGPDGAIYVLLPQRIARIAPAN